MLNQKEVFDISLFITNTDVSNLSLGEITELVINNTKIAGIGVNNIRSILKNLSIKYRHRGSGSHKISVLEKLNELQKDIETLTKRVQAIENNLH